MFPKKVVQKPNNCMPQLIRSTIIDQEIEDTLQDDEILVTLNKMFRSCISYTKKALTKFESMKNDTCSRLNGFEFRKSKDDH